LAIAYRQNIDAKWPQECFFYWHGGGGVVRYRQNMPSLQRFSSNGHTYWRIVESYRRQDGRPTVRTLMYLGKADDLLAKLQNIEQGLRVKSVSSGAVDALYRLATELDIPGIINRSIQEKGGKPPIGAPCVVASATPL